MRRSLNPIYLAGIGAGLAAAGLGAGFAVAGVAAVRLARSSKPPEGAVVFITGGSRGLGFAIASRFGRRRVRLVLVARDLQELQAAQARLLAKRPHLRPEDFYLIPADLADPAQCRRAIYEAFDRFGRIDVLVNNAGIIGVGPVESLNADHFEHTMRVNFLSAMQITWAALPRLLKQQPLAGWRRRAAIVNIASIGGKIAVPHMLPYSAAKFAMVGFSEGLHAELRAKGIRVTTVCPGLMRTGGEEHAHFHGNAAAEARWFKLSAKTPGVATTPKHAANRVYRAVALGLSEIVITPQAWLGARLAGLCPATTQRIASLANHHILPSAPNP